MLTVEQVRERFTYDAGSGEVRHLGGKRAYKHTHGYLFFQEHRKTLYAHRLAWVLAHGDWPDEIDHINGDKADNRLCNLRSATRSQNLQNLHRARRDNKTGFLGVGRVAKTGKFTATIYPPGEKRCHLGCFDTAEEAHLVYLAAKRRLHPFVGPL